MDEVDELAGQLKRRRALGNALKLAFYCSPLLIIGFCSYRLFVADLLATKYRLDDQQRAEIREAIAAARNDAVRRDRAYQVAVASAANVGPRPDLGPCPYRLGVRLKHTKEGWQSPQHNQQFPWRSITRSSTAAIPGSSGASSLRISADFLERELDGDPYWTHPEGPSEMVERARALPEDDTVEVILLVDRKREPAMLGKSFVAGELFGTAYLYDHGSGRILCAGNVEARSSDEVGYTYYQRGFLDVAAGYADAAAAVKQDFAIEVERAIALSLEHLAGPI